MMSLLNDSDKEDHEYDPEFRVGKVLWCLRLSVIVWIGGWIVLWKLGFG